MVKARHSWSETKENRFSEYQKCINCDLYRFKALGIWLYSYDKDVEGDCLVEPIPNEGCNSTKKKQPS